MVVQNDELNQLTKGERECALLLAQMPLCCVEDQAGTRRRAASGVHAAIRGLRSRVLTESVRLGCVRPQVERMYLTDGDRQRLGLASAVWHDPQYLIRLMERLPAVESIYAAAASLTGLGALRRWQWVDSAGFDAAGLYEEGWALFFWAGPLRVESRFATLLERLGEEVEGLAVGDARPRPSLICCVVYDQFQAEMVLGVAGRMGMTDWVRVWCADDDTWHGAEGHLTGRGWLHQPAYRRKAGWSAWNNRIRSSRWAWDSNLDLAQNLTWIMPAFKKLPHSDSVVKLMKRVVTTTRAAAKAEQAAREAKDAAEKGPVTSAKAEEVAKRVAAATERAAAAFEHLQAVAPQWADSHCECGAGEGVQSATCQFHDAVAIITRMEAHLENPVGTRDMARLLYAVAEWPAATVALARALLGEKPRGRRAQRALMRLTDLGLLVRWKTGRVWRYRVTKSGMEIVAVCDRESVDGLWKRIQMDRWDKLGDAKTERRFGFHEYGVVDLATRFAEAGCRVVNGWREWVDMGEYGGIAPDAMIHLQSGPFGGGWHYVEYERSKTGSKALAKKLRGFDSPRRKNAWPLIMVCASQQAERNVQQWATQTGVQIATTTMARLRCNGAVGNAKCWLVHEQPVQLG